MRLRKNGNKVSFLEPGLHEVSRHAMSLGVNVLIGMLFEAAAVVEAYPGLFCILEGQDRLVQEAYFFIDTWVHKRTYMVFLA